MPGGRIALAALILLHASACSERAVEGDALGRLPSGAEAGAGILSFSEDIQPIFEARCISCHSCYDAPCQLKLTAYEGLTRGGSTELVYDGTRLRQAPPSRLFFDATTTAQWRDRGFHDVLSGQSSPDNQSQAFSILAGFVNLKNAATPVSDPILDESLPLDNSDEWQCPATAEEFGEFASAHPLRGMPYALPGLTPDEVQTIVQWIAQGAVDDTDYSLSESEASAVEDWEEFLNGDSAKSQLVARYIYEHLFLGSLYFDDQPNGRYFQLVRSRTPPGQAIDTVATRRPYDDPGTDRVFYRLRLSRETPVAKSHMPYRLDEARKQAWTEWFFDSDYEVTTLPGYEIESASNPFVTFAELPVDARYRFLLSEANFTVTGFIKGPVCNGQSAVNVINEHFWVFFVDPDYQSGAAMESYLTAVSSELDLPAEEEDTLRLFDAWNEFADKEKAFLEARREFVANNFPEQGSVGLDAVWSGDGSNPNAALTVFRHFDYASVDKGLIGQPPKTAWIIDYPLFERIHYLLVAGFDVFGNVSHQLLSRVYMDFLRMEGESTFLLFLPRSVRGETRQFWYRDADDRIGEFMSLMDIDEMESRVADESADDPQLALYEALEEHIGEAMHEDHRLYSSTGDPADPTLATIERLQSAARESFSLLPNSIFLELIDGEQRSYFSLIKNVGHLNNTSILLEELNVDEQETTVSVVPGFIGARPNALMSMNRQEFQQFAVEIEAMSSESDYAALVSQYGLRRTNADFWTRYDRFSAAFRDLNAIDYGVLDLRKLENR